MAPPVARARHPLLLLAIRLDKVFLTALAVLAVATIGFIVIADYTWFDALYMSVVTLATVGYGEVEPLDTPGRVWAIAVIAAGFATFVYAASVLTSEFVS